MISAEKFTDLGKKQAGGYWLTRFPWHLPCWGDGSGQNFLTLFR